MAFIWIKFFGAGSGVTYNLVNKPFLSAFLRASVAAFCPNC